MQPERTDSIPNPALTLVWSIIIMGLALSPVRNSRAADEDDPAMQPPAIFTQPSARHADAKRAFQGIPTIERTASGRLWAAWFARTTREKRDDYVVLVTSDDDGKTWSRPQLVIDPAGTVSAFDPCLWLDPDGMLWLFWAQSHGRWDGRGGVWCMMSEDSQTRSPTWSAPRRICHGVMLNKPAALSSDQRFFPVSVWARPPDSTTPSRHRHHLGGMSAANVYESRDFGQTVSLLSQVRASMRVYDEHHIIERKDRSLWMLIRTSRGIAGCESADGGRLWTEPELTRIPHVNSRFCIRRLQSGNLLLITHEPPDRKTRSHLVARISADDGKTWQGGLMLDERPGISYPDATEGPKGALHVIYDFERTGSRQILLAQFSEKATLLGKPTRSTRLRVVVNEPPGTASPEIR